MDEDISGRYDADGYEEEPPSEPFRSANFETDDISCSQEFFSFRSSTEGRNHVFEETTLSQTTVGSTSSEPEIQETNEVIPQITEIAKGLTDDGEEFRQEATEEADFPADSAADRENDELVASSTENDVVEFGPSAADQDSADGMQPEEIQVEIQVENSGGTSTPSEHGLSPSANGSRASSESPVENVAPEEGDVQELLNNMLDQVAGPLPGIDSDDFSPSTEGGEQVFQFAMEDVAMPIKTEPGDDDSEMRSVSEESYQSTASVGVSSCYKGKATTSRSSPPVEHDRLLRNLGLRTRGGTEIDREGSAEIEGPEKNGQHGTKRGPGRPAKKGDSGGVKSLPITKKKDPPNSPRFSTVLKRVCVFTKCENYLKSPPNVFGFPDGDKKPLIRRKWLEVVNNAPGVTKKLLLGTLAKFPHYGLCAKHFSRQTDFKPETGAKLTLLDCAVPLFAAVPTVKSQFARKTVVPVTKIASQTGKGLPLVTEEPDAEEEGDEALDDSDRDTDWEKSADAKAAQKKKALRKAGKRKRNEDSSSEESSDDEADYDVNVPGPALILRPPPGKPVGPAVLGFKPNVPIQPRILSPTKPRPVGPVMVMIPGPGFKPQPVKTGFVSIVPKDVPRGPGRPPKTVNLKDQVVVSLGGPSKGALVGNAAAKGGGVRLVLQKITPLPPPPIVLPPKIIVKSPIRVAVADKQAQVVEEELDPDSADEEIQEMMKEAHEEILELKYSNEDIRLDLVAEKKKGEHLETRVAAWIRAYFAASSLEAERLEMMDELSTYYLNVAKKADEELKTTKAELETFRNNYTRSQKETESYRAHIIELQGASSREIERIQTAKSKTEKEAQETIKTLRSQLGAAVAERDGAMRAQKVAEDDLHRLSSAANHHAAVSSPTRQHYQQASSYQVAAPVQHVYTTPTPPTPTPTPKPRARASRAKAAAAPPVATSSRAAPAAVEPAKKRGRKSAKETAAVESPPTKRTRETSVDRAVRYLMSL